MQKIGGDRLLSEGGTEPTGVAEAQASLRMAYAMIETKLADNPWIAGDVFTMADCAAAPALFYAETLVPFGNAQTKLKDYYERLMHRPSFARVLDEARPYFRFYPYRENLPAEFREDSFAR